MTAGAGETLICGAGTGAGAQLLRSGAVPISGGVLSLLLFYLYMEKLSAQLSQCKYE